MKKCCIIFLLLPYLLQAQKLVQEATFHLNAAEYSLSLQKGLEAFDKDSARNRFTIARIIAVSYERMGLNEEAVHWYEKLIHPKNKNIEDIYQYAVSLKNNGRYLSAIRALKKYQLQKGVKPVEDLLQSCRKALNQLQDSTVWKISNFKQVNTTASDFGWTNGNDVFFISSDRHVDSLDMAYYKWTGLPYQRIFYAQKIPHLDSFSIEPLPSFINRNYAHASAVALTPGGDTLFFTATDSVNDRKPKVNKKEDQIMTIRNGLYFSVRDSGRWQKPVAYLYNNTTQYHVMHPAIDKTGQILVFASDQPDGYGGMDLYYSVKERDSVWSPPCNLGSIVNSSADEVFPTFDATGLLRFSSNRFAGRGGLDIYETEMVLEKDTAKGLLVHLPYPFNSAADDFLLMDGKEGSLSFSSNRPGGMGMDDIYIVEQVGDATVKLYFSYQDSTSADDIKIQSFVGLKDLRTGHEWIQVLPEGKSYFTLPVQETMKHQVMYYSVNGKKYMINDTVHYHPSYPKYGMIKRYPSVWSETEEEKEPVMQQKNQTILRRKKKKGTK